MLAAETPQKSSSRTQLASAQRSMCTQSLLERAAVLVGIAVQMQIMGLLDDSPRGVARASLEERYGTRIVLDTARDWAIDSPRRTP